MQDSQDNWTLNISLKCMLQTQLMEDTRPKQNIVFCVLILLSNLMTLALIAGSPRLRRFSKFHIIASMSVANIVASLTFFPLDIHETIGANKPIQNLTIRILLRSIHIYCTPSIIAVSIVCLGVDYLVNRVYKTNLQRTIITSGISILVSWSFGLLSLIMLSWTHLYIVENSKNMTTFNYVQSHSENITKIIAKDNQGCEITNHIYVLMIIQVLLWGFMPLSLAFTVVVASAVMRRIYKTMTNDSTTAHISASADTPHGYEETAIEIKLLDIGTAMVVSVAFSIPFLVEILFNVRCTPVGHYLRSTLVSRTTELMHWSVAFILPVILLLDPEFRKAATMTCDKACLASSVA